MSRPNTCSVRTLCILSFVILVLVITPSCSPPPAHPSGPGDQYSQAKDFFEKGNLDRAIEHTESLSKGTPPNEFTDRARVMRVMVYAGQVRGYKEMVDALNKGLDVTKNSLAKSTFGARRRDDLQRGAQAALYLAQASHLLTQGDSLPKDLTLDLPYPTSEGSITIPQLTRVMDGGMVGEEDLDAATLDAQRKGIDDSLAESLGGDRAQARNTLKAGPAKLDTYKFSIFLAHQLWNAAALFDRKHLHEPDKFRTMCTEADEAAKIAQATLKDSPDKNKAKEVNKIRDEIKTAVKSI